MSSLRNAPAAVAATHPGWIKMGAQLPSCPRASSGQNEDGASCPSLPDSRRKGWEGGQGSSRGPSAVPSSVSLLCPAERSQSVPVGWCWRRWEAERCAQEHPLPSRAPTYPQPWTPRGCGSLGRLLLALPFPWCDPGELSISLTRE